MIKYLFCKLIQDSSYERRHHKVPSRLHPTDSSKNIRKDRHLLRNQFSSLEREFTINIFSLLIVESYSVVQVQFSFRFTLPRRKFLTFILFNFDSIFIVARFPKVEEVGRQYKTNSKEESHLDGLNHSRFDLQGYMFRDFFSLRLFRILIRE